MINRYSPILLVTLLLGVFCSPNGNSQAVRKYSNEFLAIGVGARSLGMSGAFVSAVNDATSGYWNPAGLTGIENKFQGALMHSEYFAGIAKYDYGALAMRIDPKSVMALSVIRFGIDNIPDTSELIDANGVINYDRIKSFSAADYAFILSYARQLKLEGMSLGGSAKVIHRKVGEFAQAWGFGLDAGMRYQKNSWRFAAMARDVSSTFNAWSFTLSESLRDVFNATGNVIPQNSLEITLPTLTLAFGKKFNIKDRFTILTAIDFRNTFDGMRNTLIRGGTISTDPVFGLEAGYKEVVFLRGGVGNFQSIRNDRGDARITTYQPNIGVGLRIRGIMIDYALSDVGDQSTALFSHVFSLRFDIKAATNKDVTN